jgi:hypothetical protein
VQWLCKAIQGIAITGDATHSRPPSPCACLLSRPALPAPALPYVTSHPCAAALNPAFKGYISAAHGQRDEARGEYYNYTLDFVPGWGGLGGMYHIFTLPDSPTGLSGGGGGGIGSKGGSGNVSSGGGGGGGAEAANGAAGRLLASIRADPAYIHRCECVWVCPGVIV